MVNVNILKVIERYKVAFDHGPDDMYIEVYQDTNGFFAECNYSLWLKKQDSPYHHRHSDHNIERAVEFVLNTLKPDSNLELEDFCWILESNRNVAILGTGEIINSKDFKN